MLENKQPDPTSGYAAIACRLTSVRPHPNGDRIRLARVLGNQVVIGLDHQDGELGVFFGPDGALSHEFCVVNGLYTASARASLGLPPLAEGETPGFFDTKRRVRAQRFRGERSDGIWLPVESLTAFGQTDRVKEGDTFTEFGGSAICAKYINPATRRALGVQQARSRRELATFPKHDITTQFRFVADQLPDDAIIYVSEKLHGTSGRTALAFERPNPKWWQRLFNIQPAGIYTKLDGSKNVILQRTDSRNSWYGTDDFRLGHTKNLALRKAECIYFEIVGYVHGSTPIMPAHDVTKTGLKDIFKTYGPTIHYTYGCPEGESRIYVYRICQLNEDGLGVDLSWPQLVARCAELGLAHVPLLAGPLTKVSLSSTWPDLGFHDAVRRTVEMLTDGPSTLNPAQIREGVVVRIESKIGTAQLKNKSHAFGVLEGYLADTSDFVDPEVVS